MRFLPVLAMLAGALPSLADGLPDLALSTIEMTGYHGAGTLVVPVQPDGTGPGHAGAFEMKTGLAADASLALTIRDSEGYRILLFPAEDVWLESVGTAGTLAGCTGPWPGTILADPFASDLQGRCFFTASPRAGGWSDGLTQAFINGESLWSSVGVAVRFVSPDIDGNLEVNLSDAGFFGVDLFGVYHIRSDLNADGVIDLSDAGFMGTSIGKSCTSR